MEKTNVNSYFRFCSWWGFPNGTVIVIIVQVRKNNPNFKARTQSSIAVSSDGVEWVLFNASPDILTQFNNSNPYNLPGTLEILELIQLF